MSLLKIKQINGPAGGNQGATIVFDNNKPQWSSDLASGLLLPKGNQAARPGTPVEGLIRYNTSINKIEAYEGGEWKQVISDSELLKRFSFRINFVSGALTSVDNLPSGWSFVSLTSNSFVLDHNRDKAPYDFTMVGKLNESTDTMVFRPKSGILDMTYSASNINRLTFRGITFGNCGTYGNGQSIFWVLF